MTTVYPIEYDIPEIDAHNVLRTLQTTAINTTEILNTDSAFANVFIDRGETIFVECRVDMSTMDVCYMVCVNPDDSIDYELLGFDAARRQLNGLLKSIVLF